MPINEYLQTALMYMGVPEVVFSVADPMTVLTLFVFSSRILTFLAAVGLWSIVFFVKFFTTKGMEDPFNRSTSDHNIHQYDMNNMHRMYNMDQKPSMLGIFIKGFVLPVLIIFLALTFALEMAYG